MIKVALTVAGSDSGGGAGIQADLKTFAMLGVFGTSAITSLTAQNTQGVQGIYDIPPAFIGSQIDSVMTDIGTDAMKTGMLSNAAIIELVAAKIREYRIEKVVVDPVMVATSGDVLLQPAARDTLQQHLLPLAYLVTPNRGEAEILAGQEIKTVEDMRTAAKRIYQAGAKRVLIKGGHFPERALDLLYDGKNFSSFESPHINTPHTHGTGCVLSAAITAELAKGASLEQAIDRAKRFITSAIRWSLPLGKGHGPANPLSEFLREKERYALLLQMEEAIERLKKAEIGPLIPEVQSNLGLALPLAESPADVIAIPGRIIRLGKHVHTIAAPRFGASQHVAKIILTVMRHDPAWRAAMNIRYSESILEICRKFSWRIASFSRAEEPTMIKEQEGSSLEWGVEKAIQDYGQVPDIIYDLGDLGKEPMIRVLGPDAHAVITKVLAIGQKLSLV